MGERADPIPPMRSTDLYISLNSGSNSFLRTIGSILLPSYEDCSNEEISENLLYPGELRSSINCLVGVITELIRIEFAPTIGL